MRTQLLNSGAITCSAMLIYGWTQAAVSEPNPSTCQQQLAASEQPKAASCSSSGSRSPILVALDSTPEQLLPTQWGDRQADHSHPLPTEMEAVYGKRLEHAQAAANQDQFTQAIADISGIPKNSRHYELVQRLQEDWARELLRQATHECQQAQLKTALALLDAIPSTSSVYSQVGELRTQWQQQAKVLQRAIDAKNIGDWQGVITAVRLLEETPAYNSLPVQGLLQQAITQLYEPDQNLLRVAVADLPTVSPMVAPPEQMMLPDQIAQ